ncbi:MAG: hypothetical protein V4754_02860 [Pseudomonadota bacterium]
MFRKQLLYLSNDQLWAYRWRDGRLSPARQFTLDNGGLPAFARWLGEETDLPGGGAGPAYLLADLIEEDFQRHLLPHVGGKARRAMLARKLNQLYRDTPYRHALIQQREPDGRRDDSVLFSALTNPASVQPWVQVLEQQQVALAGIYSATLLSSQLLPKLALGHEHLLLVSQQSGGLRESYFAQGQLKFSRLTPTAPDGAPANVVMETEKTRQFLTSTRLLARGQVLHAVILAAAERLPRLRRQCQDNAELVYQFGELEWAADRLAVAAAPAAPERFLVEHLLLARLAKRPVRSHYGLGRYGRYYTIWQARLALYGASAALAMCAVLWLGANLWDTSLASSERGDLDAQTARLDLDNRALRAALPPSQAKAANMKAAVEIERMVGDQGPMPGPMLAMISGALEQVPQISLTTLEWQARAPAKASPSEPVPAAGATANMAPSGQDSAGAAAPISSLLLGLPSGVPQELRLEAEVALPATEYRSVLDSMHAFAQALARQPRLQVAIEQAPVDVRPSMKLSGKAGSEPGESRPRFSLKLVWTP